MNPRSSFRDRAIGWCAGDDPNLTCGRGPLARYIYIARLIARGSARLARNLTQRW